jgi:hypothetical protein
VHKQIRHAADVAAEEKLFAGDAAVSMASLAIVFTVSDGPGKSGPDCGPGRV